MLVCLLAMMALPMGVGAQEVPEGQEVSQVYQWTDGETSYALLATEDELGGGNPGETWEETFSSPAVVDADGSFYSQLTSRQKACYRALESLEISRIRTAALVDGYRQIQVTVPETEGIYLTDANSQGLYRDIFAAIVALRYDRPDALWLSSMRYGYVARVSGSTQVSSGGVIFSFRLRYEGREQEMWEQSMKSAQAIADSIDPNTDRYTQVKSIHDQLAAQSTYNYNPAPGDEETLSHQAYSCLVAGDVYEPVCDGYAKAVKVVCDLMDIPCVVVVSSTHMWNNILMDDGDWYNLDLTWDDTNDEEISYLYFLIGSQTPVGGELFYRQPDHVEKNSWSDSQGVIQITFSYPTKNHESYTYLGEDYPPLRFPDVKRSAWYYGYVENAAESGLFQGDEMGYFRPQKNISRGEFVQVLFNAMAPSEYEAGSSTFTDVSDSAWYATAVAWAQESGYINGYLDGTFRPSAPITREEMCMVFYKLQGSQKTETATGALFPDDSKISGWAREAVYACRDWGLVSGDDAGRFNPGNNTVRCEAAKVFVQYFLGDANVERAA